MPSVFSAIGDLMQKKPKVPKFKEIDVGALAAEAIATNRKNLPEAQKFAADFNADARMEQLKALDAFMAPGLREQLMGNIASAARGELPKDVQDLVERRAAERSTAGGYGGSMAGRNLSLRDLGLTTLQRSDWSLDANAKWLATAREGMPLIDWSAMFVDYKNLYREKDAFRSGTFQRDWMKEQLDAAYAPSSIFGQNLKAFDAQMSRWMDATYGTMLSVAASQGGGQGQAVAGASPGEGQFGAGGYGGSGAPGQYTGGGGGMMGGGKGMGTDMGGASFMGGVMGSDVNTKKNFKAIDEREVLEKLATVPVTKWNYKDEDDESVPHIGPMAQDFIKAFYPGRDDKSITLLEFAGVALAAIQGLNAKVEEQAAMIYELQHQAVA